MFSFFRRKKTNKEEKKEPKRPPRRGSMGMNQSSKTTPANEIFTTPPGSPVLKPHVSTVDSSKKIRTVPTNKIDSGDLEDDEGDSKASPPNNVNNGPPSRPPRGSTSDTDMGNNISKFDDIDIDSLEDDDGTNRMAPNQQQQQHHHHHQQEQQEQEYVSKQDNIMDTTNQSETDCKLEKQITDKTDVIQLDISETDAFTKLTNINQINNVLKENIKSVNQDITGVQTTDILIKNNQDLETDRLNISENKNSGITPSFSVIEEKSGSEARKPTSNINIEKEESIVNETVLTLDYDRNTNIDEDDSVNGAGDDQVVTKTDEPIAFIDDSLQDEQEAITSINDEVSEDVYLNGTNSKNEEEFEEDTRVSVLVKETREVICMAEKDIKKCDAENVKANMIINSKSGKQLQTAVNQVEGVSTFITDVLKDDVKECSTNGTNKGGTSVICCQQALAVNSEQQCSDRVDNNIHENMLSVRTRSSGIETFSSSPPKVTDSETEEDSSTKECLQPKLDQILEKDEDETKVKLKKHVHWADSEGRTLESFEQSSSSEDEDEEQNDDENNKITDEKSSSEEEDVDEEDNSSSSSEEETLVKPKQVQTVYKRQDTWLDVVDDHNSVSKTSDASEPIKNDDSEEEEEKEETSEEESSESEREAEEEQDEEEYQEVEDPMQNELKTDSNVRSLELDNSSLIPVHELYDKIARLQEEIMIKASGLERQRTEIEDAYNEVESMKLKSTQLEDELYQYKCRNSELTVRMCDAESKLLTEGDKKKLEEAEKKIAELENELQKVKLEKQKLEETIRKLERERDQDVLIVREALDDSLSQKEAMEDKYKKEFEQLRSLNSNREVQMLDDFEWKLREVERLGKKKLAETEKELSDKIRELSTKLEKAEEELSQVAHLKLCEIELKQLRTTAHEHRRNLRSVTRQLEDLQVDEKILQEEVNRLRAAIDREKAQVVALQNAHKEELAEKDRKTQFKLQVQQAQLNSEWEEKVKQECSKLKSNLEKLFREEKMVAIETEKRLREHEVANNRQLWERKLDDVKQEINNYKRKLEEKEEQHKADMERARTHSDRDVLDLRRKMDKLDMHYQEKIEKLQESHDQEILAVREEFEKKIQNYESSAKMHMGTTRTTLELVKQQMANECEIRIEQLQRIHQEELEDQWEKLQGEKDAEIAQLKEEHSKALELVERKLEEYKRRFERSETVTPSLKKQSSKDTNLVAVYPVEDEMQVNKDKSGSRDNNLLGAEIPTSSQCRSAVEYELRETVEKLTKQVYEDKLEIARLREQLSDKLYPKQQAQRTQPQTPQQQSSHHHHRRSRKSKSGRN